jgi:hypothetical protein
MAWACMHTIEGGHLAEYDKVNAEMGDIGPPDGLIVHVACPIENGFRLIDVWESREQYERFRDEHIIPAMRRVFGGDPSAPQVFEPMEVHRIVRG